MYTGIVYIFPKCCFSVLETPQNDSMPHFSMSYKSVTGSDGSAAVGPYWSRPANAKVLTGLDTAEVFACFRDALGAPADR